MKDSGCHGKKKWEIVKKQNKRPSNKTLPAMLKRNVEC